VKEIRYNWMRGKKYLFRHIIFAGCSYKAIAKLDFFGRKHGKTGIIETGLSSR
jgi:hypothetical protein